MTLNKYFKNAKSVLCLDGNLPDIIFFKSINLPIIAADGASNKLLELKVKPSVIIGDLDSINQENFLSSEIIYKPDQNQTDFQKSLQFLKENNLLPTIICGANGGFLDHILNNINIILENNCFIYDYPIIGYTINGPNKINLELDQNTKISLLGINEAKVSTSGLKWELKDYSLKFPGNNSCHNRTKLKNISIEVIEGKLLALIYIIPMQDNGAL